jgi:hypothetical protein
MEFWQGTNAVELIGYLGRFSVQLMGPKCVFTFLFQIRYKLTVLFINIHFLVWDLRYVAMGWYLQYLASTWQWRRRGLYVVTVMFGVSCLQFCSVHVQYMYIYVYISQIYVQSQLRIFVVISILFVHNMFRPLRAILRWNTTTFIYFESTINTTTDPHKRRTFTAQGTVQAATNIKHQHTQQRHQ